MIYTENNKYGVLSLSSSLIDDIIKEAALPYKEKIKFGCFRGREKELYRKNSYGLESPGAKQYSYSEKGIFIEVNIMVSFGTPIHNLLRYMLEYISKRIIERIELSIDDIIINITATYSKRIASRDISQSYRKLRGLSETEN